MYKITAMNYGSDPITIYDPSIAVLPVLTPKCSLELNQPGSLEFQLVYGHTAFQNLTGMKTYVTVEKDGIEIFYGRVLSVEPAIIEGQESVVCEGALSFLNDGYLAPDPRNSGGTYTHQTQTAEAFFNRVIDAYNADIGTDSRRNFTVGEVSHSRKNETKEYQITSFMSAKEALENQLLNQYGGFIRIRPDGNGGHLIDWVESYGREVLGTIELGENVISQTNRLSGEELFTAIRPVGKDGLVHSTSPVLNVYPAEDMLEYGIIIKNVDFPNITTEAALLAAGSELISKINKTLYISSEISVLDLHFVDEDEPDIRLGDTYTSIEGLSGVSLTISSHCMDFENPQNDSISLKNAKHLEGNGLDNFRNEGSASKRSARNSGGVSQALKYYHEAENRAVLYANKIEILGDTLDIHTDQINQTANNVVALSHAASAIYGTGVIQNSEAITNFAGQFEVVFDPAQSIYKVNVKEGSSLQVQKDGIYSEVVGQNQMSTAISQTASAIRFEFRNRVNVYYQPDQPTGTESNPLKNNDLWIMDSGVRTYNDMSQFKYSELASYIDKYRDLYGAVIKVYKNGSWVVVSDEQRANLNIAENEFTEDHVNLIRGDLNSLYTQFYMEKGEIRTIAYNYKEDTESKITQTASQIRSEVNNAAFQLQSNITQQADRISLVVEGTGSNAHIKPAQIVAAINAQTGQSAIKLSADMIELDGAVLANVIELSNDGYAYLHNSELEDPEIIHSLSFDQSTATINCGESNWPVGDIIVSASSSGNVLTLYTMDGETVTFSKATTLDLSSWSGSVLTMAAKQNGTTVASKTLGFGGLVTSHDIELQLANNGSPTKVANLSNVISCPVKVEQLTMMNPVSRYTRDVQFSVSSLLQTKTASANGDVTPDSGYIGLSKVTVNVSGGGTIDIPTNQIYTSSTSRGTKLTTLVTRYEQAKADSDYVMFRVDCGGSSKWYYMEP